MSGKHHHRSGPLKQLNKTHKQGKHRSKSQLDNDTKGMQATVLPCLLAVPHGRRCACSGRVSTGANHHKAKMEASKLDRRNRAKQIRETKRAETVMQHRLIGGVGGAPQVVGVVGLCANSHLRAVRHLLQHACLEGADDAMRERIEATLNTDGPVTIASQRLKSRLTVIEAPRDLLALLDMAKVCSLWCRSAGAYI